MYRTMTMTMTMMTSIHLPLSLCLKPNSNINSKVLPPRFFRRRQGYRAITSMLFPDSDTNPMDSIGDPKLGISVGIPVIPCPIPSSTNDNVDLNLGISKGIPAYSPTQTPCHPLPTALRFEVLGRFNRARAARLTLPHHVCQTPLFMPVGTQGTIKGLTTNQLEDIGCQIILGNTYHLALRPTSELLEEAGGLHKFMNWPRAMLTDSGGFQMVSLLHLADITEKGVTFQSPADGKPMLLTPEESIQIQNRIGADIIMALDDVVKTTITGPRVEEAMYRTLRWIDRCIQAHQRPDDQNLFGIVQGGLDPLLRDICVKGLVARNLPGYAIGGLSGGEDKDSFWRIVAQCTAALPEDKPRYVMGVGYPLDIVVCSALGADMYDCVYPTRTARFGTALVPEGVLKLKHRAMADDLRPIDSTCSCMVCKNYTRAYIHCLVTKDAMGSQLLSYHNLYYMMRLSRDLHSSIVEGRFPEFVCDFLRIMFPKGDVPEWVCNAMEVAGIDISSCCAPFPSASKFDTENTVQEFDQKSLDRHIDTEVDSENTLEESDQMSLERQKDTEVDSKNTLEEFDQMSLERQKDTKVDSENTLEEFDQMMSLDQQKDTYVDSEKYVRRI